MSRRKSAMLYGVAILMMVYHHLFCLPSERLGYPYISVLCFPIGKYSKAEQALSWFCKMCVAIYAFISGYGMYHKVRHIHSWNQTKEIVMISVRAVLKILRSLWIVLAVFLPILYLSGNLDGLSVNVYIKTFLGLDSTICGEWWYIRYYFEMLLILPFLHYTYEILDYVTNEGLGFLISLVVYCVIAGYLYRSGNPNNVRGYLLLFWNGYCCSRYKLFDNLNKKNNVIGWITDIVIILVIIALRIRVSNAAHYYYLDIFTAALFIWCLCRLIPDESNLETSMIMLGKRSTFMWLTHSLYAYKLLPKYLCYTKVSMFMVIILLLVSYVTAVVLDFIQQKIEKGFIRIAQLLSVDFFHRKRI